MERRTDARDNHAWLAGAARRGAARRGVDESGLGFFDSTPTA